jgi:hypothetical protein
MTLSLSTAVLELRIALKVLSYELLRRLYPEPCYNFTYVC